VGENVLQEKTLHLQAELKQDTPLFETIKSLGFGQCRLSIAVPSEMTYSNPSSLQGTRIATSYPYLLRQYLSVHQIDAQIVTIAGSVEIAPRLGMADAICDLVSSGKTLSENHLKEVEPVIQSQAVIIKTALDLSADKKETLELLQRRINGVLKAQESKYIMFHAPKYALTEIKTILPGCETPTIVPLEGYADKVAVHVVSPEGVFWTTLEKLKAIGANSILVLPIEKMME
jgi:ATP phosphoribosyltransferase